MGLKSHSAKSVMPTVTELSRSTAFKNSKIILFLCTNKMSYSYKILLSLSLSITCILIFGVFSPKQYMALFEQDEFWLNKTYTKKKFNIVIGGDSRTYRGINPDKLNEGLANFSLSIINMGYSFGGFSQEMLTLIEEKLNKNQTNKVVLLGITPLSLTPNACSNKHLQTLKHISATDVYLKTNIIPRYFALFEPISVTKLFKAIVNPTVEYYDDLKENGWDGSYCYPQCIAPTLESYKLIFINNQVNLKTIDTLQRQIQKWNTMGIKTYTFRPPSTKAMEEIENEKSGFNESYTRKKIEDAGGIWLDIPDRFGYQSYDGSHLPAEEANRLSLELGKLMKSKLL